MAEHNAHKNALEQKPKEGRRWSIWLLGGFLVGGLVIILLGVLFLLKLFGNQDRVVGPGELGTPLPTETSIATSTPLPVPTATSTPLASTPVSVAPAEGWTFEGVRVQPDPGQGGLVIYGEAINDSGSSQRILSLQGTFYDAQGSIVTPDELSDYWPIETVPTGWRMPFELTLVGLTTVDRVTLQVITERSDEQLHSDIEVTELKGADVGTEFCVEGRARNLGQPLDRYLMVVGVLYDGEGRVINWGIGYQPAPADLTGDNTVVVSACAERYNQDVARYELRAWGEALQDFGSLAQGTTATQTIIDTERVKVQVCSLSDADGDLLTTDDQAPLEGWTVRLLANDQLVGQGEVTGADGCVLWSDQPPNNDYKVEQELKAGWKALKSNSYDFGQALPGDSLIRSFINKERGNEFYLPIIKY